MLSGLSRDGDAQESFLRSPGILGGASRREREEEAGRGSHTPVRGSHDLLHGRDRRRGHGEQESGVTNEMVAPAKIHATSGSATPSRSRELLTWMSSHTAAQQNSAGRPERSSRTSQIELAAPSRSDVRVLTAPPMRRSNG